MLLSLALTLGLRKLLTFPLRQRCAPRRATVRSGIEAERFPCAKRGISLQPRRDGAFAPSRGFIASPAVGGSPPARENVSDRANAPSGLVAGTTFRTRRMPHPALRPTI